MVFSIYPTYDSTLMERYPTQNVGFDSILEIMQYAPSSSYDAFNSRALILFDISEISQSISSGVIPTGSKFFLSLKCSEAYQLPLSYTIDAFAVSSSWETGIGRFANDPITTAGDSWKYRDSLSDGTLWISGSSFAANTTGSYDIIPGGGNWYINYKASQSFSNDPADINMDVTDIFNVWINNTIPNRGLILKWDKSSVGIENLITSLKFFSIESNTIFLPKVDIKWDDHVYATESVTYSTALYSASVTRQNIISNPTITLPDRTSLFTYTTGSATFVSSSLTTTELTSSFIYYNNIGKIESATVESILITGSFSGFLSCSFQSTTLLGSGSGYFLHNGIEEFLPASKSISITNNSGSYVGYFSGSLTSLYSGISSGSFSGSLSGSSFVTYDKLYVTIPARNTYYYISGSQYIYATSSAIIQSLLDNVDIVVYPSNLKSFYKQDEKASIQINSRPRYPVKTYTTSSVYKQNYRLAEESYYSVRDASSEDEVISFDSDFTKLSCGGNYQGNYFTLFMSALQPERNYRLLIKTIRGETEEIFDNKFIFKVVR